MLLSLLHHLLVLQATAGPDEEDFLVKMQTVFVDNGASGSQ